MMTNLTVIITFMIGHIFKGNVVKTADIVEADMTMLNAIKCMNA